MQEQERLANEEVEKRLKATLTAKTKREAGASASRVASPAVGTPSTSETPEPKANAEEAESTMEVDSSTVNASSGGTARSYVVRGDFQIVVPDPTSGISVDSAANEEAG